MRSNLQFDVVDPVTVDGLRLRTGRHSGYLKVDKVGKKSFWIDLDYRPQGLSHHEEPPEINVTHLIRSADPAITLVDG